MRKITLLLSLSFFMLLGIGGVNAQLLLKENFNYAPGALLVDNGWTAHSGAGSQSIDVTTGLSFAGYTGTDIGGAAHLDNTGEDVNRTFTSQTSGLVYAAMVVKTSAGNSQGYFFHFGQNPWNTTLFSRLNVNAAGDALGIGSTVATWVPVTPETPTLVVVKYNIDTKESSLYVFTTFPTEEPATAAGTNTETATSVGGIGLRQYNASEKVVVDGIRVATTWADAVAPLSKEADILTFTFAEQTGDAIINTADHTVAVEVAIGTNPSALVPTITLSDGATVNPVSEVTNDFTNPATYTVTSQDGTTELAWTVTVTVALELSHEADILTFVLAEEISTAMISSEMAQVTSTIQWDADLSMLEPVMTVSDGAQVTATTLPVVFDGVIPVEYKVTAADGTTEKLWSVLVMKEAAPAQVTIYDIQFTEDASGDSPYAGQIVRTGGYVTGVAAKGFYLQDVKGAWNGVYVYTGAAPTVKQGDMITITALVKEYYNLTELDGATIEIVSSDNVLPEAEIIAVGDFKEAYEGVLVTVEGVTCSVESNNYGEWTVTNETGSLTVDDEIFRYTAALNDEFVSITGPGTYTFSVFKLLPRSNDDVVKAISTQTNILTFTLAEQHSAAVIDADNHTVSIEVNEGTDVTALVPTITVSNGAMVNPASGVAQDFTSAVTYTVTAEDNVTTMDWEVTVSVYVGINNAAASKASIYPNPVNGQLFVTNMDNVSKVIISNVLGQDLMVLPVTESKITLNTANLRKGIYIVTLISTDGVTRSERIVKE